MPFCPIPHTLRDQAWFVIGAGIGATAVCLAYRSCSGKKTKERTAAACKLSKLGLRAFDFDVRGQKGGIPCVGIGTATLFDEVCVDAVRHAIRAGYRHIDTALLYDNQEAVGRAIREAIAAGEVTRDELWVTSKVGFYPGDADGTNTKVHIKFHACNKKGHAETAAAVDLCLQKLGLSYVDLMLIHNPATEVDEYEASGCCHFFELGGNTRAARQISEEERAMIFERRLAKVGVDREAAAAARAETWRALEEAKAAGKVRFIGVSNYPVALVAEMEQTANVLPCVNQLELHPRFASPELQRHATESGYVLTGYGSGNSVQIESSAVVARIAQRTGLTPLGVVLRWTLRKGVACVPRSADPMHIEENLEAAAAGTALSAEDIASLDALDEEHPYYWSPLPAQRWKRQQP